MNDENDIRDPLRWSSDGTPAGAGDLREVSDRLLAEISRIRHLELESRKLQIGSPEFERLSEEVAVRSRNVFRLSHEQQAVARALPPQSTTINDLWSRDRLKPGSRGQLRGL